MTEQEKSKIIIDEDWKSQVEEEKEQLKRRDSDQSSEASVSEAADTGEGFPPASFTSHLMTLATQATAAMGQIPDPSSPDEPPPVNLGFAQYMIDLLDVLQEKTSGNLTEEEAALLENLIHQLRMLYVEVSTKSSSAT
ncbi:MAG: hypothetical protein CMJ81_15050 [Planctomycetaceae bacterium]|nr:hypothetical protein [Planctomycetaceae bacterium]MBP62100.1 hypothetical protein [Planctomycetaceae bacterium]